MKKQDRITAMVQQLDANPAHALDPHYLGYFTCFNAQQYYEAHDVLEHLWLRRRDSDHHFYKGLIQVAGAFVHLQKQYLHPTHPKHAPRLRPAVRLFRLGIRNLTPYGSRHLQLDVAALLRLCEQHVAAIIADNYERNPWHPERPPRIELIVES